MNRYSRSCLVFALSISLTGCVGKTFPLLNPVGTSIPATLTPPVKAPVTGTLRVRVSWPKKYFSNTIPISTDAFELIVQDSSGSVVVTNVLLQGSVLTEIKLMPGNNYALKVLAYRNHGTANQELVAQAYTPGINIQPAKLTAAPISLCPVFVPYLSAIDYNVTKRNDTVMITGNNFTPPVFAEFNGASQSLNLISSTSLSLQIPATAFSGNLSITADGVKSENDAFLWILDALTASTATDSLPLGGSLQLTASPSYFIGDAIPAGIQAPLISWESMAPGIAVVDETGKLTGVTQGTVAVHAKLGVWTSNDLNFTVTPPLPAPTISRFSRPDSTQISVARPGDPVCIEGTGFNGDLVVDFNGATSSVTATESTKVWVPVPANANTGFIKLTANGSTGTSPSPLWILNANPVLTLTEKAEWDTATGTSEAYLLHGMSLPVAISASWAFKPGESEANYLPLPVPVAHTGYTNIPCQFINATTTATASAYNQDGDVYAWVQYPEAVIRQSNQLLFHIVPSWVQTFAGNYANHLDGIGTSALLEGPKGLTLSGNTLYFTDKYRIRKVDLATKLVSTLAGSGISGNTNGVGTDASFGDAYGLAIDSSGNVFVADQSNHLLRQLSPSGQVTYYPATATTFNYPTGLAFGVSGLFFTEMGARRVSVINASGNLSVIAGNGLIGTDNGPGASASFTEPTGLAISLDGNIYVADSQSIRKIDTSGYVSTLAGGTATGFANGVGTAAAFNGPRAIAIAPNNDLYIADYYNNAIRKIDTAGNVTTVAGSTVSGISDGPGTGGNFDHPCGIAVGPDGSLYVTDRFTYRIRRIILPK